MRQPKPIISIVLILTLAFVAGWEEASTCSTFALHSGDELVFGGNLDFYTSRGLAVVNKTGVAKTAFLAPPETPVTWVSKYGSITFNQVGREFPFGGLNKKGLVIQMMWLEATQYPATDARPGIEPLQWIQYHLDNAATVAEVLESDSDLRISSTQSTAKLHYLVCDKEGNVAVVEFIDGRPVYLSGESLPIPALANSTYESCLSAYKGLSTGERPAPTSYSSADRFVRLANAMEEYKSGKEQRAVDYAFDMLASVKAPKRGTHCTAWSIVYDIANMRMHFRTFENSVVRTINFNDFDFSCSTPVMVMDMNDKLSGNRQDFVEYSSALNAELVSDVMAAYKASGFLTEISPAAIEALSQYPKSLECR